MSVEIDYRERMENRLTSRQLISLKKYYGHGKGRYKYAVSPYVQEAIHSVPRTVDYSGIEAVDRDDKVKWEEISASRIMRYIDYFSEGLTVPEQSALGRTLSGLDDITDDEVFEKVSTTNVQTRAARYQPQEFRQHGEKIITTLSDVSTDNLDNDPDKVKKTDRSYYKSLIEASPSSV